MDNYDDQIKPLILRMRFDIKLREFVGFMFLRYKNLLCLEQWIEILENQKKYSGETKFLHYFKHLAHLKNESVNVDLALSSISLAVNNMNVSDDLIIDMLKFIDLKNYS